MSKITKIWIIIAIFLILLGNIMFCGVMNKLKWDFTKLSTAFFEINEYEISEKFKDINIMTNTANIELVPSSNSKSLVVCHEQRNVNHSVKVENNSLIVEIKDTRRWYEHIGILVKTPQITIYLPENEYGELSINTTTGKVDVVNVNSQSDIKINVSTGKTNITDTRCKNMITSGKTGSIFLENVIASEKFSIRRSTGDVNFKDCDANDIFVNTSTGSVKGNLLTDKTFFVQSDTGSIDVPKTMSSEKCEINTSTGNINFTID